MANEMDDAFDELAEVSRRQDAEWREVEEELEENVEYSRLRRRTLADLAVEAMHTGAVVAAAVGTRSFTGAVVQVGPDSMTLQDGHGNEVGLELAALSTYRVVESATGGPGRPKRGGEPGAFADLLVAAEHEGVDVEIGGPALSPLSGVIAVVAADHVVLRGRGGLESVVPRPAITYLIRRPSRA